MTLLRHGFGLAWHSLTLSDTPCNTRQVFRNLKTAQEALDEWVTYYNTQRPHQALGDVVPESRFSATGRLPADPRTPRPERNGEQWVCRTVASMCRVATSVDLLHSH